MSLRILPGRLLRPTVRHKEGHPGIGKPGRPAQAKVLAAFIKHVMQPHGQAGVVEEATIVAHSVAHDR